MLSDLILHDTLRTIAVMQSKTDHHFPVSQKTVFRIMVVLIVFFSLMAGYYQSRFEVWKTNNNQILEKFQVKTTQELLKKQVEVK
jgi:hypothetical protein